MGKLLKRTSGRLMEAFRLPFSLKGYKSLLIYLNHYQKRKSRSKNSKQGLDGYAAMYDTLTELAIASSCLTFGQLIQGDGDKAKADNRRFLYRGARARRSTTAAVGAGRLASVVSELSRLKFLDTKREPS